MMISWFLANKLIININKTCYSTFLRSKVLSTGKDIHLFIGKPKVCKTANCRYFGVFIYEHLNWKVHIDYVYKKLLKLTGIFYKIRNLVPYAC